MGSVFYYPLFSFNTSVAFAWKKGERRGKRTISFLQGKMDYLLKEAGKSVAVF